MSEANGQVGRWPGPGEKGLFPLGIPTEQALIDAQVYDAGGDFADETHLVAGAQTTETSAMGPEQLAAIAAIASKSAVVAVTRVLDKVKAESEIFEKGRAAGRAAARTNYPVNPFAPPKREHSGRTTVIALLATGGLAIGAAHALVSKSRSQNSTTAPSTTVATHTQNLQTGTAEAIGGQTTSISPETSAAIAQQTIENLHIPIQQNPDGSWKYASTAINALVTVPTDSAEPTVYIYVSANGITDEKVNSLWPDLKTNDRKATAFVFNQILGGKMPVRTTRFVFIDGNRIPMRPVLTFDPTLPMTVNSPQGADITTATTKAGS